VFHKKEWPTHMHISFCFGKGQILFCKKKEKKKKAHSDSNN